MKLRKIINLLVVSLLITVFSTACTNNTTNNNTNNTTDKNDNYKIAMVTDVAGVNDHSFNQSAWEGLEKAQKELGVNIKYLESKQEADYVTNVETLVDEDIDLIIAVGSKLAPTIEKAAKDYPDKKFVIVDETYKNIPENVEAVLFNAEQSAYLVGLIGAKMTKTNNVGFIGGMDISVINTFKYGYMAGVNSVNNKCEIQSQYANSFSDQAKGKAIATQMISDNADVIFIAAGDVGTGAIEAIKEKNKYAIGVDRDQNDLAPKNVITSAIKRVDIGVYQTVVKFISNEFEGGSERVFGLEDGAVGIAESSKNLVPEDILNYVNEEIEKIKNGEIKVPSNEKEYDEFMKNV